MANNPFDDTDATFRVVVNDEGQHALWPDHVPVPMGWTSALGPNSRQQCLDYIDQNWTDLRPSSLRSTA